MVRPAAGGYVPATNSLYDPATGQFTGYNGLGQALGKGGAGTGYSFAALELSPRIICTPPGQGSAP